MSDGMHVVGSFEYETIEKSNIAQSEQDKINKLESQMDYNRPGIVYSLYCKIINKKVFKSPEGLLYLTHLQQYLFDNEAMLPGPIPPIPASNFTESNEDAKAIIEETKEIEKMKRSLWEKEKSLALKEQHLVEKQQELDLMIANGEIRVVTEGEPVAVSNQQDDNNLEGDGEGTLDEESAEYVKKLNQRYIDDLMQKYKTSITRNNKLQHKVVIYRIAVAILFIAIGAMIFIASKSNNPTILNYREKVQDEYATWDQELKNKESELNQRERDIDNRERELNEQVTNDESEEVSHDDN